MNDIPTGFLKLPEMEYYQNKPVVPYNYPTSGMMHSSKFKTILDLIFNRTNRKIYEILDGHALQKELSSLSKIELSDFCRHILIINRDHIGWQIVDNYLALLEKQSGIPSWERPDFIFADDFNQMFSSILRWDLEDELSNMLMKYTNTSDVPYLSEERIIDKLKRNYQFWSVKELFLLFEGFVEQFKIRGVFTEYIPILIDLAEMIMEEIKRTHQLEKQVALLTMFSRGYVHLDHQAGERWQELVDRTWVEVEQTFPSQDVDSYRYLFAVMYGHIGTTYYQHNIGFIDKRRLLNRIRDAFFRFEEIDIAEWLDHLLSSQVETLVIEYIHNGYYTIVNLLHRYAQELPPSDNRKEIVGQIKRITRSLYDLAEGYLSKMIDAKQLSTEIVYLIERHQEQSGELSRIISGMTTTLVKCFSLLIYYIPEHNWEKEQVETIGKLKGLISSKVSSQLYIKHLLMLTGNYPYEDIIAKIRYESSSTQSIVNSSTFEKEIMDITSRIMDEIKETYSQSGQLLIDKLYQLFFFNAQWLQIFYNNDDLFHDVLLMNTPVLSIILIQLIQAYYEQQKYSLSLIMYLIMQHFTVLARNNMDVVGGSNRVTTVEYMANDFREMIEQWDLPQFANINSIAGKIKNIQFYTVDHQSIGEGMLDDDLMIGFLEIATELENAINVSDPERQFEKMEEELYKEPYLGPHLFDRIGYGIEQSLDFPLIRDPYQYNAAVSVIPFDVNLENTLRDLDIDNLIEYFFKTEEQ